MDSSEQRYVSCSLLCLLVKYFHQTSGPVFDAQTSSWLLQGPCVRESITIVLSDIHIFSTFSEPYLHILEYFFRILAQL
jgi:hypothetical protein